mmetsp:Transcript_109602/g.153439  ORF Transcript_109602/g.153439 Transcript_109602/m.153439 type:complete len:267 (+) Transcript_109602:656-1456(+)
MEGNTRLSPQMDSQNPPDEQSFRPEGGRIGSCSQEFSEMAFLSSSVAVSGREQMSRMQDRSRWSCSVTGLSLYSAFGRQTLQRSLASLKGSAPPQTRSGGGPGNGSSGEGLSQMQSMSLSFARWSQVAPCFSNMSTGSNMQLVRAIWSHTATHFEPMSSQYCLQLLLPPGPFVLTYAIQYSPLLVSSRYLVRLSASGASPSCGSMSFVHSKLLRFVDWLMNSQPGLPVSEPGQPSGAGAFGSVQAPHISASCSSVNSTSASSWETS